MIVLSTLAMPVRIWRTGEAPVPPLPLAVAAPAPESGVRFWIDTDAACGAGERVDPDDCFALLLLARAAPKRIAGVSAVGGNAPLAVVEATLRELMAQVDPEIPVHGAADSAAALTRTLEHEPLAILALGPLTNVAAALRARPDLARNVERLVVVMGRRVGHLFHPSEGRSHGMLFGHGPVFRDFNYAQDPGSAGDVGNRVAMTMVPYEAARRVVFSSRDLDNLAATGGAAAWVASRSREWLEYWRRDVGLDGFYPFDLVAAAYLLRPEMFRCAPVRWWIRPAPRPLRLFGIVDPLFVGVEEEEPEDALQAGSATYCPELRAELHGWLLGAMR